MKVIVGLGNPGKKYQNTRHNIGFMVIDLMLKKHIILSEKERFQSKFIEVEIQGERIYFLKPQTYMNLSGNALQELVQFYKLDPKTEIVVVYDDKDLPLGKIRLRKQGSAGGHNGMKSIIQYLGEEFCRIKCGIGSPNGSVVDFVIGDFQKKEESTVQEMLERVVLSLEDWIIQSNFEKIMQKYNTNISI